MSNTWDGVIEPELQAEPVEQATPSKSKFRIILSREMFGKNTFDILIGNLQEIKLNDIFSFLLLNSLNNQFCQFVGVICLFSLTH